MNNLRLRIVGGDHVATDGLTATEVACLPDDYTVPPLDLIDCNDEATARRIVVCVNRLAPFTTEQIEDCGFDLAGTAEWVAREQDLLLKLNNIASQRNQLLAALEVAEQFMAIASDWNIDEAEINGGMRSTCDLIGMARAAIASVKGGADTSSVEEFLLVWFDTAEEWVALLSNGHVLRGKYGAVGYAQNAALAYLGRGEAEFDVLDLGGDGPTYRYVKNDEHWQEGGAA